MVKEAEANAAEDKKKKEKIEAVNQAESLAHQTEKNLKDFGDKVDANTKSALEASIKEVRDVIAKEDATVEEIKAKTDALTQAAMKLGELMYQQNQAQAGASAQPNAEQPKEENGEKVVDAEFEDKK